MDTTKCRSVSASQTGRKHRFGTSNEIMSREQKEGAIDDRGNRAFRRRNGPDLVAPAGAHWGRSRIILDRFSRISDRLRPPVLRCTLTVTASKFNSVAPNTVHHPEHGNRPVPTAARFKLITENSELACQSDRHFRPTQCACGRCQGWPRVHNAYDDIQRKSKKKSEAGQVARQNFATRLCGPYGWSKITPRGQCHGPVIEWWGKTGWQAEPCATDIHCTQH